MFSADTELKTSQGDLPIAAIRAGNTIQGLTDAGVTQIAAYGIGYRTAPPELIRIQTEQGRSLTVTPDHSMFCRFLPGPPRFDVVLVKEVGLGAVLVSGARGMRETGDSCFRYRTVSADSEQTEEIYLLASFDNEKDALLHRKILNTRFGVPESTGGYRDMGQGEWKELFLQVDTILRAHELLEELGMDPRDPHWVQRSLSPAKLRRHLQLEAIRYKGYWYIEVRRPDRPSGRPVRLDGRSDTERLRDLRSYEDLEHVDIYRRFEIGWAAPYRRMRAAAIHPGMGLPCLQGDRRREDRIVSVETVPGSGMVYSPDTPDTLALLVDGLVVAGPRP